MDFTDDQKNAINCIDNNLQIIACAGSGKTQVISQRIVNILKIKKDIQPGNIVAFTYTEKAAAELKTRILKLCKEQIGEINGIAEMYIGTIHSWCLKSLQDILFEYQKFSVLDEIKLKLFIERNYKKIGMPELDMQRYKDTKYFIQIMSIIRESELNSNYEISANLKTALEKYETCLFEHCYFDFTMIMTRALKHFEDNELFRKKLKDKIRYLIVDEYQDVNPIQEKIIENIYDLGVNICTVGDDDQTIYQWRGSDIKNIHNFRSKYNNVEYIKLEDNFRSHNGIVKTAMNVISNNIERLDKVMNAQSHQQYEKGDMIFNQYESVEEENDFIAETINKLRGVEFQDKKESQIRGLDYSDFCIILRKWKKAEKITAALQKAGIPFIVQGVNRLFLQPEVIAAFSILRYLALEIDKNTLTDLWLAVSDKISSIDLEKGIEYLDKNNPKDILYYESFNMQGIFIEFLDICKIKEDLFDEEGNGEIAGNKRHEIIFYNLGMFSQVINDYEVINFMSNPEPKLSGFLNFVHYIGEDYYPEGWLSGSYKTPNAVQIMTVYQSKGLEFPVVFIPGLNQNYLPAQIIGGKSIWHFIDKELIKGVERYEGGNIEDERRLLYVAITRSEKFLFVSRAPDSRNEKKESVFASEIRSSDYIFSSQGRSYDDRKHTAPKSKTGVDTIQLNFSVLKSFFDCPYSFKFYCMYGFTSPLSSRMGYGRSIHNILMEIHRNYLDNKITKTEDVPLLLDKHLHFPYAIPDIKKDMRNKADKNVNIYLDKNREEFKNIEFAEKDIQIDLGEGIIVNGRMDLIKKKKLDGNYETYIIDFKSSEDAQTYNISMEQLSLYALGYKELTGENADFLQIYNLDKNDPHTKELLGSDMERTKDLIRNAANDIRNNHLDKTCNDPKCVCRFKK